MKIITKLPDALFEAGPIYQAATAALKARVADVFSKLTLDEKIRLLSAAGENYKLASWEVFSPAPPASR